jgi:hypothetical protein
MLIESDLIGVQQSARLQMRGQMHRAQTTVQLADRRCLDREAVRRDFTCGKKLVERLFARNQLAAEWLCRRAHPLKNCCYLLELIRSKPKLRSEAKHVGRARIAVKLGRLRHAHAFAFAQRGDILVRKSLDLPGLLPSIGGTGISAATVGRPRAQVARIAMMVRDRMVSPPGYGRISMAELEGWKNASQFSAKE